MIPEPLNLRDLILPETLTKLDDGTNFMQYDSASEQESLESLFMPLEKTFIYYQG